MIINLNVKSSYVIAYNEDVGALKTSLIKEGLSPEVIRPDYSEEERGYSGAVRCMLNHVNAWKKINEGDGLSLVVESDFVPVRGLGSLPLPFPESKADCALGYLYAGGATLFDVHPENLRIYGRGHASCTVAYVIGPEAARCLLEFAENELQTQDLAEHNLWDCRIRMFLQERGVTSWLPYRQYGEHGGIPNPEHARAGHNPSHQSDTLYGPLHFIPAYARQSYLRYRVVRVKARMRGIGRLIFNRYVHLHDCRRAKANGTLLSLLQFSIQRHFYIV
jgi:hypothetical protein